jgi:uncharacterized protein YsxB (DUF464 family)
VVTVRIRRDSRSRLSSFLATGHAGWAESGRDLACAAVSVVLQTAWVGLSEVARVKVTGMRRSGRVALSWPASSRSRPHVRAIVETAARSVEYLAVQYPDHIKVVVESADDG